MGASEHLGRSRKRVLLAVRRFARQAVTRVAQSLGQFPTPLTGGDELQALLDQLHPVETGMPLVRIGPPGDGGYLVPDDLGGIVACFSPGVDLTSEFEMECAERGMEVFLADRSVDRPARTHDRFHFVQKHVGAFCDEGTLTLDNWVAASLPNGDGDLLLQMDVEGAEYEVILNISDQLMDRFRIIVAEFHHLDMLRSRPVHRVQALAFAKILKTHACVHAHPNNCCGSVKVRGVEVPKVMEFTFLRRDRGPIGPFVRQFPHPLDFDNTGKPHLVLPASMYRSR